MKKNCLFSVLFVSWMTSVFPQTPTQVIRGKIIDAETKIALPGANIVLMFSDPLKGTFTGGEYYIPIDLQKSIAQHREVLDKTNAYVPRLPSFFYLDLTLTYRINYRKISGILAVQIKNSLNHQPDVGYLYDDYNQTIEPQKSLGILPLISYKIEF